VQISLVFCPLTLQSQLPIDRSVTLSVETTRGCVPINPTPATDAHGIERKEEEEEEKRGERKIEVWSVRSRLS
jgi:hypothetical protein